MSMAANQRQITHLTWGKPLRFPVLNITYERHCIFQQWSYSNIGLGKLWKPGAGMQMWVFVEITHGRLWGLVLLVWEPVTPCGQIIVDSWSSLQMSYHCGWMIIIKDWSLWMADHHRGKLIYHHHRGQLIITDSWSSWMICCGQLSSRMICCGQLSSQAADHHEWIIIASFEVVIQPLYSWKFITELAGVQVHEREKRENVLSHHGRHEGKGHEKIAQWRYMWTASQVTWKHKTFQGGFKILESWFF